MTYIFIPSHYPLDRIEDILAQMNRASIDTSSVVMADSFADMLKQTPLGDQIVVYSLDCFASLIDLLDQVRGRAVVSLCEPWFTDPSIDKITYLELLYGLGIAIHRARTQRGLSRARNQGKTLGRAKGKPGKLRITDDQVARVEELRREQKLSLAAACRLVGCSPNSYNTYYKHKSQNPK